MSQAPRLHLARAALAVALIAVPTALTAVPAAGCTRPRAVAPARAQVRIDVAARALARARAQYEHTCPRTNCDRTTPTWARVDRALSDAELWLDATQQAGDAWAAGDGRRYAVVRPCLATHLTAVADAFHAAGQPEPHALRELFDPAPCELDRVPNR